MATKQPPQEMLADAEFNKKWELEPQYTVLRKSNDPRFGEITLLKNKANNDMIFAKEKMVTSKQQASNDIRDLKSRIALNHPNLHKLLGYSTAIQKELCSTNYLSKAYYEFPKSDLQKEMNDLKKNGLQFPGEDLLNAGSQAIHGLHHLHKLNINHGDVRPINIGYNRETREVQILDRLSDPSPLEKLQVSNIINKKELFICPEVYKRLQGKDKTTNYNPFKNDLYSLGLSLLMVGNQESIQNVYKPNGDFNQENLKAHLAKFNDKYGQQNPQLVGLVQALVSPNEADRYTASELIEAQQGAPQQNVETGNNFAPQEMTPIYSDPVADQGQQIPPQQYQQDPALAQQQHNDQQYNQQQQYTQQQQYVQPQQYNQQPQEYSQPQQYNQPQQYTQPQPQRYNSFFSDNNMPQHHTTQVHSSPPQQTYTPPAQNYQSVPEKKELSNETEVLYNPTSEKNMYTFYDQGQAVSSNINYVPVERQSIVGYTTTHNVLYPHQITKVNASPPSMNNMTDDAKNHPGERLVTVHKMDGTSYSYWTSETSDQTQSYDKYDPSQKSINNSGSQNDSTANSHTVYSTPPDSYIYDPQAQQHTTVTYINQPISMHKVNSGVPEYIQQGGNVQYITTVPQTYSSNQGVYMDHPIMYQSNQGETTTTYAPQRVPSQNHVVHSMPTGGNYVPVTYMVSDMNQGNVPIEVRRGHSKPDASEIKSTKKKYLLVGDKVIEVPDDQAE